jgi:hypothetical protein
MTLLFHGISEIAYMILSTSEAKYPYKMEDTHDNSVFICGINAAD